MIKLKPARKDGLFSCYSVEKGEAILSGFGWEVIFRSCLPDGIYNLLNLPEDYASYPDRTFLTSYNPLFRIDSTNRDKIKAVIEYVSNDQSRMFLTGFAIDPIGSNAQIGSIVATDGKRMSYFSQDLKNELASTVIVNPTPQFLECIKEDCELLLSSDGKSIKLIGEDWEYYGLNLDVQFPNWKRVIPIGETLTKSFQIPAKKEMAEIVKNFNKYAKYYGKKAAASLFPDGKMLYNDGENLFEIGKMDFPPPEKIHFDINFLKAEAGSVVRFSEPNKATLLDCNGRMAVIMPCSDC